MDELGYIVIGLCVLILMLLGYIAYLHLTKPNSTASTSCPKCPSSPTCPSLPDCPAQTSSSGRKIQLPSDIKANSPIQGQQWLIYSFTEHNAFKNMKLSFKQGDLTHNTTLALVRLVPYEDEKGQQLMLYIYGSDPFGLFEINITLVGDAFKLPNSFTKKYANGTLVEHAFDSSTYSSLVNLSGLNSFKLSGNYSIGGIKLGTFSFENSK